MDGQLARQVWEVVARPKGKTALGTKTILERKIRKDVRIKRTGADSWLRDSDKLKDIVWVLGRDLKLTREHLAVAPCRRLTQFLLSLTSKTYGQSPKTVLHQISIVDPVSQSYIYQTLLVHDSPASIEDLVPQTAPLLGTRCYLRNSSRIAR